MAPISRAFLSTFLVVAVVQPTFSAPLQYARHLAGKGAANAGASVGSAETALENAGSAIPKMRRRQGNKIANGAATNFVAAGASAAGNAVTSNGDCIDGPLTSGAANAGASISSTRT